MRTVPLALAISLLGVPALADGFRTVSDRGSFVQLVSGKELTRLGIKLTVSNGGAIQGSAFGRSVRGDWNWKDGFFCRDLYYGDRDLGPNCQLVKVKGETLRFIADRGAGIHADLRLR